MTYFVDSADLTSIANAIRTKGGTEASLEFPDDFESAIAAIPANEVLHATDVTVIKSADAYSNSSSSSGVTKSFSQELDRSKMYLVHTYSRTRSSGSGSWSYSSTGNWGLVVFNGTTWEKGITTASSFTVSFSGDTISCSAKNGTYYSRNTISLLSVGSRGD